MDDIGIISLFAERSEEAVRETKLRYGRLVFSVVMRILGSETDAEKCENGIFQ